jgi:hypothetical protein
MWVVEGVDGIAWLDVDLKARAGRTVANGKLDSIGLGVPEQADVDPSALPLGQFSGRRIHFGSFRRLTLPLPKTPGGGIHSAAIQPVQGIGSAEKSLLRV